MNKENNRSAAGLRRSAIVERIRLREEWSELKGINIQPNNTHKRTDKSVLRKRVQKDVLKNSACNRLDGKSSKKNDINKAINTMQSTSEVLHGIVALVEVGAETRALALRAALTALGATVVPSWSPLVTHLIWQEGGCRATRAKARALACRLVSPLWVEACAAAAKRLPSQAFPAAARASDLPSPRTLRVLLKKAEMENIPLDVLLSSDKEDENKQTRLRLSSDTDNDTSRDKSSDASHDKSRDTTATDIESRVNTAPRRAVPKPSVESPIPAKSRRKLFTHREGEMTRNSDEDSDADAGIKGNKRRKPIKITQRERKQLARAERIARRLVTACGTQPDQNRAASTLSPRIVLTGMDRTERHVICDAIRSLNGKVQSHVNKRTTHVILGTCQSDEDRNCSGVTVINHCDKQKSNNNHIASKEINDNTRVVHRSDIQKARTLNALLGAARGCRVLNAQWILDSEDEKQWIHHHGYEVAHLKKISLKARIERTALCKKRREYAYDVFNGMRVQISRDTEQKDAAVQLLNLCGAVVLNDDGRQDGGDRRNVNRQNGGGNTQYGGDIHNALSRQNGCDKQNPGNRQNGVDQDYDITIGIADGEVSSKWVFDSVAAARMRTTRRYINNRVYTSVNTQASES